MVLICYVLLGFRSQVIKSKFLVLSALRKLPFQLAIVTKSGEMVERISPWIRYAVQPKDEKNLTYDGVFWNPPPSEVKLTWNKHRTSRFALLF